MRVLIPTLLWGRHNLFELWAEHHKSLPVDVLVCGSEGNASRRIAERHGFAYAEAPNQPLGRKAQLRLEATKALDWDYLLFLGSDDFIPAPTLAYYLEHMQVGYDFIAPLDLFLYAAERPGLKRRLWYSAGYTWQSAPHRVGEPMAVGRALSRAFVERLDFRIWPSVTKYIDRPAWQRIREHLQSWHTFRLRDNRALIFDVKSRANLSRFNPRRRGITRAAPDYMARAGVPLRLREALSRLPY